MLRIAIGGLMHESNTFAGSQTRLDAFESGGLETGDGIRTRWGDAHHEVAGFFDGARRFGFQPVPTLMAWAVPSGPLTADTYRSLTDRLVDELARVGPVNAVLLALHGAMVADGQDDADGHTLARVREVIGPDVPLIATLDYHANVSRQMASAANALVAYQTYPHIDQRQRGEQAAVLAVKAACGEVRPTMAVTKPALLIPLLAQDTEQGAMGMLLREQAERLAKERGVLSWSILAGFPYADVAATGPSCVVVADCRPDLAQKLAGELAGAVWNARKTLTPTLPTTAEAVKQALEGDRLTLLIDLGDNIGGGSAADSTVLIHELLRQHASRSLVVLYDPAAVQACASAGVGNTVSTDAGGKIDHNAPPISVRGTVLCLHDGRYVEESPRHGGIRHNDQGLTAVVEMQDGNLVVVNSLRHPPFSLGQLTSLGLHPEAARVIVVKAAIAYKAAYAPLNARIIEVDTPGLTAANLVRFTYQNVRRPVLPLDPETLLEAHWR